MGQVPGMDNFLSRSTVLPSWNEANAYNSAEFLLQNIITASEETGIDQKSQDK